MTSIVPDSGPVSARPEEVLDPAGQRSTRATGTEPERTDGPALAAVMASGCDSCGSFQSSMESVLEALDGKKPESAVEHDAIGGASFLQPDIARTLQETRLSGYSPSSRTRPALAPVLRTVDSANLGMHVQDAAGKRTKGQASSQNSRISQSKSSRNAGAAISQGAASSAAQCAPAVNAPAASDINLPRQPILSSTALHPEESVDRTGAAIGAGTSEAVAFEPTASSASRVGGNTKELNRDPAEQKRDSSTGEPPAAFTGTTSISPENTQLADGAYPPLAKKESSSDQNPGQELIKSHPMHSALDGGTLSNTGGRAGGTAAVPEVQELHFNPATAPPSVATQSQSEAAVSAGSSVRPSPLLAGRHGREQSPAAAARNGAGPVAASDLGAAGSIPTLVPYPLATISPANSREALVASATTPHAPSSVSDTFTALDGSVAPSVEWVHAGGRRAEAGYLDPSLGWISVQAESAGNAMHASLIPGSSVAAQVLASHLPALNTYVAEHHGDGSQITLASSLSGNGSVDSGQSPPGGGDHPGSRQHEARDTPPNPPGTLDGTEVGGPPLASTVGIRAAPPAPEGHGYYISVVV